MCPLIRIEEVWSEMYDVNHLSALPAIQILVNRDMRIIWSIVSNAALRSNRTRIVPYVLLRSHKIFVVTLVIAVPVDFVDTYVPYINTLENAEYIINSQERRELF